MKIEIAYANKNEQFLQALDLPENTTVQQAIEASDLLKKFEEINVIQTNIGIFSKKVTLSTVLNAGDRIEIYRPLIINPMQKRRRLAAIQTKK